MKKNLQILSCTILAVTLCTSVSFAADRNDMLLSTPNELISSTTITDIEIDECRSIYDAATSEQAFEFMEEMTTTKDGRYVENSFDLSEIVDHDIKVCDYGAYFTLGKVPKGTHTIGVIADLNNTIEESDKTNNRLFKEFTWYSAETFYPDLIVEILSPLSTMIEGSVNDTDTREFTFDISNIGLGATSADGFQLGVYVDGIKIKSYLIPQMNGGTAIGGRFNMTVNAYKPITVEMVVDDLNKVEERNENNNSDSRNYDINYCTHRSVIVTQLPFPASDLKVQLENSAFFGNCTQNFYASHLAAWNGITDKVKIKNVSVSDTPREDTQVLIYSAADKFDENILAHTFSALNGGKNLQVIELNNAALSKMTAAECTRTIVHELGHVFGMAHPNDSGCDYASIMYQHNYSDTAKRSNAITTHDRYALCKRYNELSTSTRDLLKEQVEWQEEDIPKVYVGTEKDVSIYWERISKTDSEDILSNKSTYIVRGKCSPEKQNILIRYDGYTQTNFIVDKVYKGSDLHVGDTIQLREPYYTQPLEDGSNQTIHMDDYLASKEDTEYIFFLNRQETTGLFTLSSSTLSRYAVNDKTKVSFPHSNADDYSTENYEKLKTAVMEKYK